MFGFQDRNNQRYERDSKLKRSGQRYCRELESNTPAFYATFFGPVKRLARFFHVASQHFVAFLGIAGMCGIAGREYSFLRIDVAIKGCFSAVLRACRFDYSD
jgi:hypothetical protein